MSIDEVMKFVERVSHYDPARPQDLSRLRAAIEQHVAEEVAEEREECAKACETQSARWHIDPRDVYVAYECVAAIRARAEKETK